MLGALTLSVVILVVAFILVFEPINRYWKKTNNQIQSKTINLAKNQKRIKQAKLIEKEYDNYGAYVKLTGSDEEILAKVLTDVESLAQGSLIRINNIKPQDVKQVDFYKRYAVELNFESNIKQLIKFIYELQKSNNLLCVERLKTKVKPESNELLENNMIVNKIVVP